ncbi:MAG: NAD-dependent epimerase/dehydratase family protein [Desulfobacterales bacterium]
MAHTAYVLPPIHDRSDGSDQQRGTKNVLAASAKTGVKQILYTSSTTAYGFYPDNDQPLTEDSPAGGNDDFTYAKNKKEIEAIFKEFESVYPEIAVSIVRPCFVGRAFQIPWLEKDSGRNW